MYLFGTAQLSTPPPDIGSVEVALCGYGSYTPQIEGAKFSVVTQVQKMLSPPDQNAGQFSIKLYSNDLITPAGTYYTFTVKDANGDIVQIEAYQLTPGQHDITDLDPYDPNLPPPPLPTPLTNQLLVLPASSSMVFDGSTYASFKTTLTGDVTGPAVQNMVPGNLYTFIIVQDSVGGHAFVWPTGIAPGGTKHGCEIDVRPNETTVQTFVADENGMLWAIGPGMVVL